MTNIQFSCKFTCNKRKRRAAVEEKEENLYHVSLGPFIATDPLEVEGMFLAELSQIPIAPPQEVIILLISTLLELIKISQKLITIY